MNVLKLIDQGPENLTLNCLRDSDKSSVMAKRPGKFYIKIYESIQND